MDIRIDMHTPSRADMAMGAAQDSASMRQRVCEARERARHRLRDTPWVTNAQLPGAWIRRCSGIAPDLVEQIDRLVEAGRASMRGADRMLRLAWTLADLEGTKSVTLDHIVAAEQLRNGSDHRE